MIPREFIQSLIDRTDIVALIGRDVPLKKAGANLMGRCPFHHEKTPSFTVSPTKQFYHCFGCGAHGTAVGYIMARQNLEFVEAIRELAKINGVDVPEDHHNTEQHLAQRHKQEALYAVLQTSSQLYQQALAQSGESLAYLRKRGINPKTCAEFCLGFAPDNFQWLMQSFREDDHAFLIEAGLRVEKEDGRAFDRFRNRLLVPIIDRKGRTIGFGGRTMGDDEPKYLNSPETPVFHKGRELYGLFQAQEHIRKMGVAIVVEGYFDAIALAQAGIHHVVATMGTAFTAEQLGLLWPMCPRVILCYDGDNAGIKASLRAVDIILPTLQDGRRIEIVRLPEGQDPDEAIREKGVEAMNALLAQGKTLSDFMMDELTAAYDDSSEAKGALVRRAQHWLSLINQNAAPVFYGDLIQRLATLTKLAPSVIMSGLHRGQDGYDQHHNDQEYQYQQNARGLGYSGSYQKNRVQKNKFSTRPMHRLPVMQPMVERVLLRTAMNYPERIYDLLNSVRNPDNDYARCLQCIADLIEAGNFPEGWAARLEILKAQGFGDIMAQVMAVQMTEETASPDDEDLAFQRAHSTKILGARESRQRFMDLAAKNKTEGLTDDEQQEMRQLISTMGAIAQVAKDD